MRKALLLVPLLLVVFWASPAMAADPGLIAPDENTGKYTATFDAAITDNQYVLLVVKSDVDEFSSVPTPMPAVDEANLMYIDQEAATSSGVSFDFIPRSTSKVNYVYIAGEDLAAPQYIGYTAKGTGVTVSGQVVSYGSATDTVTVTLKQGATIFGAPWTGTGTTYNFDAVPPGSYTLEVSKLNHVTRTYEITVDGEAVTQNVKICLKGDVNEDGAVSVSDMQRLYNHLNATSPLTDTVSADTNADGSISVSDMQRLYNHLNGTAPLF